MSETAATRPDQTTLHPDPDSAWLAAYALGLAYSQTSRQQQVDLLREATHGQPALLDVAHRRLATTDVIEPDLRDQAQHLLDRARTLTLNGAPATTIDNG